MQTSPFRALTHYRVLPQIAGWKALVVAFAARAPYAMIPLGTMTSVTASTGSVAEGGLATATVALSTAIAGPLIGKWADSSGQNYPLKTLTPINALAVLALFGAVYWGFSGIALYAVCVGVGVTSMPIGSFTRSRWISQTSMPRELAAALSYESTADELVFVLGPALVGIAASAAEPSAPLVLAFSLIASAGMLFAYGSPRLRAPSSAPATTDKPGVLSVVRSVIPSVIVMAAIGTFFGATQAATTMRSELLGSPTSAGLVYAAMGLGSAVMAILTVAIPQTITLPVRLVVSGTGMTLIMLLATAMPSLWLTAIALTACGLFVGPSMVTAFSLTEILAPKRGIAIAMTSMQSSVTVGVSLGSALNGAIAESYGDVPAYLFASAVAVVVAAVGLGLVLGRPSFNR
ncbi:MAG: MFS transporter [Actinomycetaceae bacterium]|nr:MFS transporter [Actinomycetaceae bacterium]